MTHTDQDYAVIYISAARTTGMRDQEIINDLIACALIVAAHDIPDPRLRCRACGAALRDHDCPWPR